jgi:hypothetical protein
MKHTIAVAALALALTSGAAGASEWPPVDPGDYNTKTNFTIAWAKKLQGFKTLEDLQRAAGSKGTISDRKNELDSKHPAVVFHWRSLPLGGYMVATVYQDGGIGVGVMTVDEVNIVVNNFGTFICDECDPPIKIIGAEPSWSGD